MSAHIQIGRRRIGPGEPVCVVAEISANHNQSFDEAVRLLHAPKKRARMPSKFQIFRASKPYPKSAGASNYLKVAKHIYDIIAEMEMPSEWIRELAEFSRQGDLEFLCSAFNGRVVQLGARKTSRH